MVTPLTSPPAVPDRTTGTAAFNAAAKLWTNWQVVNNAEQNVFGEEIETLAQSAETAAAALVAISTPTQAVTNIVAVSGNVIDANTTSGTFTITLPASGGTVVIRDLDATWATTGVTLDGNGATIDGSETFALADWAGFALTFTRRTGDAVWLYTYQFLNGAE